jgi:hypothetical protein
MDVLKCIVEILPGWKGKVEENSYEKITPNATETRPLPTLSELETAWSAIEAREAAEHLAEQNKLTAKETVISDTLPSWMQVSNAVDAITNLAEAKVFIKKLSRVVYWLTKNSET